MTDDILAILMAPDAPYAPLTLTVEVTCRDCHGTGQHQHTRRGRGGKPGRTLTAPCDNCQGVGSWHEQGTTMSIDTFLAQMAR